MSVSQTSVFDADLPAPPGLVAPSLRQISLGLGVGSIGLLMLGLQPVLLGALVSEGRLSLDQLGFAATAELLTLGLTTGILANLLKPRHIRLINAAACLALAAANVMGMMTTGSAFVASRALAGIAGGFLVWIAILLITRAQSPDKLAGIFLAVQTLAQAALAAVLPLTAMIRWGANGGLGTMAAIAIAAVPVSLLFHNRFADLPKSAEAGSGLPLRGIAGLASVFFYLAGIVGLWVFVERLGAAAGASAQLAGIAVAAALVSQVTGSLTATVLLGRLPLIPTLIFCAAGNIAIAALLGAPIGRVPYVAAVMVFGFLWLFAMPFQTRLLIRLDQTRRSAMLLSTAQLLGCAAGPLVTAPFATDTSLTGALAADAALFGVVCVMTLLLSGQVRRANA